MTKTSDENGKSGRLEGPWDGGFKMVEFTEEAEIIERLIDLGKPVEARLIATGILNTVQDFITAEAKKGTAPVDLLMAFASIASTTFASVIKISSNEEHHGMIADNVGSMISIGVRAIVCRPEAK